MRLFVAALLVCFSATTALAGMIVPPGLNYGDKYQLVFVTQLSRDGASGNIDDYNSFVQSQAELSGAITENLGIKWFANVATAGVNARDNALVSSPGYTLNGTQAVTGFTDLWDGSSSFPIITNQFGTAPTSDFRFWGGFDASGFATSTPLGNPSPTAGVYYYNSGLPTVTIFADDGTLPNSTALPLFAISEVLTVVPEPTSLTIFGIGALCASGLGMRRHRRK